MGKGPLCSGCQEEKRFKMKEKRREFYCIAKKESKSPDRRVTGKRRCRLRGNFKRYLSSKESMRRIEVTKEEVGLKRAHVWGERGKKAYGGGALVFSHGEGI